MEAPPVRFVRTSDGYSIAYAVSGEGEPLVFLPVSYSHVQLNWQHRYFVPSRKPMLEALAARFRLIQYDCRGEGMSSRGLTKFEMTDYGVDLDAVIQQTTREPVIILASGGAAHVAIRYAVEHADRVKALVICSCSVNLSAYPNSMLEGLAAENWHLFLETQLARGLNPQETAAGLDLIKQTTTKDDYLLKAFHWSRSDLTGLLPRITQPTLVMHPRDFLLLPAEASMNMAAQIPGARMVLIEGASTYGDAESALRAIEAFLAELPAVTASPSASSHGLSDRELEVLRLLAAGKSNPQIADELVISLNTVQHHVSNILTKTGLANRTEAAAYAHRNNLT